MSSTDRRDTDRERAERFLAVAEAAEVGLQGPERDAWEARLLRLDPGLGDALEWAIAEDPVLGMRLAAALFHLWVYDRPLHWEAWARRALAADPGSDPRATAKLLLRLCVIDSERQDLASLTDRTSEALALTLSAPDDATRAWAEVGLAESAFFAGDFARAEESYHRAEALLLASGERWCAQRVMVMRGHMLGSLGDGDAARRDLERALALAREMGDRRMVCEELALLASRALDEGDLARAGALSAKAVEASHSPSVVGETRVFALCARSEACAAQGDSAAASAAVADAEREIAEIGDGIRRKWALAAVGQAWLALGDAMRGVALIREANAMSQPEDPPLRRASDANLLGDAFRAEGKAVDAAVRYGESVQLAMTAGSSMPLGDSLAGLAAVAGALDMAERADQLRAAGAGLRSAALAGGSERSTAEAAAVAEALGFVAEVAGVHGA